MISNLNKLFFYCNIYFHVVFLKPLAKMNFSAESDLLAFGLTALHDSYHSKMLFSNFGKSPFSQTFINRTASGELTSLANCKTENARSIILSLSNDLIPLAFGAISDKTAFTFRLFNNALILSCATCVVKSVFPRKEAP